MFFSKLFVRRSLSFSRSVFRSPRLLPKLQLKDGTMRKNLTTERAPFERDCTFYSEIDSFGRSFRGFMPGVPGPC